MSEIIQVVTQRASQWKLLIDEVSDTWESSTGPGLVLYTSFIKSSATSSDGDVVDCTRIEKAVKSLMNAKLATTSGWKTDHSDGISLSSLVNDPENPPVSIVIIPQATLSGRLTPGDKYLKYHRQVDRIRSFQIYSQFIRCICEYFKCESVPEDLSYGSTCEIRNLKVTWGSFGKRQGFELVSSGPSTHYFEF